MKILYLTHLFNKKGIYGGVDSYLNLLIRHIPPSEEVVVSTPPDYRKKKIDFARFDIIHILHLLGFPRNIPETLSRLKIPYLFTIWDFYCLTHYPEVLEYAKVIIAPSRFAANKAGLEKIEIAKPGIIAYPKISRPPRLPVKLGYFGGIYPAKGVYKLIDLVNALPRDKIQLHLFGYGASRFNSLKVRFKSLAPNITCHGSYRHSQLPQLFETIDVIVVPSQMEETFSFIAHEALSAGIPVIASRIGALPEAVKDGENGFLFTPGRFDELRDLITKIINNPQILRSVKPAAGPKISPSEHAREILQKYKLCLSDS